MKSKELDTKAATNFAWAAARDAGAKSYANSTNYTNAEQVKAERAKLLLEMSYNDKVYITYRKTFIALKVTGNIKDRNMLDATEELFVEQSYTKAFTKQGIIYRIPKQKG